MSAYFLSSFLLVSKHIGRKYVISYYFPPIFLLLDDDDVVVVVDVVVFNAIVVIISRPVKLCCPFLKKCYTDQK